MLPTVLRPKAPLLDSSILSLKSYRLLGNVATLGNIWKSFKDRKDKYIGKDKDKDKIVEKKE